MDARRKRILYRARHRGMQETDLLLGGFAMARLESLDESLLGPFEALLEEGDNDLLNWISGREAPPQRHDTPLMRLLLDFGGGAREP